MALELAAGDVLAVLDNDGIRSKIIRLGEWIQGKNPSPDHVVIVTHQDQMWRWIGIEGTSGGVGLCDVTPYLTNPVVRSNHAQPRADDQGQLNSFLASCVKSLGMAYDWVAIGEDVLNTLHLFDLSAEIDHLWRWPTDSGILPGHTVCSSLAARLYEMVGWAHPDMGSERVCEPSDWWSWAESQQWVS